MDGVRVCPFPHYSWLAYRLSIQTPRLFEVHQCRHVTHRVLFTTDGQADIAWTATGAETRFRAAPESIGFFPRDGETHVIAVTSADGYRGQVLCLPSDHLPPPVATEAAAPAGGLVARPEFRDAALTACLHRLTIVEEGCPVAEDVGDEVVARQIVLRLAECLGAKRPEWPTDHRSFEPPVMRQLVGVVDDNLSRGPTADDLSKLVGLSPSHFSRKFQYSAGLSLNRFLNRRRIRRSLALLEDSSLPLTRVAIDLGFSSQSHFTRLFSSHTGLSPNNFRRLHRRSLP